MEGATCDKGLSDNRRCTLAGGGNGVVEGSEACDDGNMVEDDDSFNPMGPAGAELDGIARVALRP